MKNKDLILVLLIGAISLAISPVECLAPLRWILGIPFVFFLSGYPLSVMFSSKKGLERLMLSSGFSLLLTYPAGVLNVIIEGKTAIYQEHLFGSMAVLFSITLITAITAACIRKNKSRKPEKISKWKLTGVLAISAILNFTSLNRADLNGDEYDIGYRSYNLVDGMQAGRNAYTISFIDHTPLASFINHFSMQIFNPTGFENLSEWMIRFAPALTGVLCVLFLFILAKEIFNQKIALFSALLLAVSNYHVWISRIFLREIFMTFFIILSVYFLFKMLKEKKTRNAVLSGIFLGALLLTKTMGIFLVGAFLIFLLWKKQIRNGLILLATAFAVFLPIIFYNIAVYLNSGYLDIFFSKIFGVYHQFGYTGEKSHAMDISGIFRLLIDQYSLILFALFAAAVIYAIFTFKKTIKKPELLFQIILIAVILGFFVLSGTRAYYMPFITVPLALATGYFLEKVPQKTVLILILAYAGFYTYNTNISDTYTIDKKWNDSGRSGGQTLTIEPLTYHYSRSARAWSENFGWQDLQEFIEGNPSELLIFDDDLDDLSIRYYFDTQQTVKQYHLDNQYEERYESILFSEFLENPQEGYLITEKEFDYPLLAEIADFNIYETANE